jgi:hypothetical protein
MATKFCMKVVLEDDPLTDETSELARLEFSEENYGDRGRPG